MLQFVQYLLSFQRRLWLHLLYFIHEFIDIDKTSPSLDSSCNILKGEGFVD